MVRASLWGLAFPWPNSFLCPASISSSSEPPSGASAAASVFTAFVSCSVPPQGFSVQLFPAPPPMSLHFLTLESRVEKTPISQESLCTPGTSLGAARCGRGPDPSASEVPTAPGGDSLIYLRPWPGQALGLTFPVKLTDTRGKVRFVHVRWGVEISLIWHTNVSFLASFQA